MTRVGVAVSDSQGYGYGTVGKFEYCGLLIMSGESVAFPSFRPDGWPSKGGPVELDSPSEHFNN